MSIMSLVPLLAAAASLLAQPSSIAPAAAPAPARRSNANAPVHSPEIHADGTVTFRLRAPNAKEVQVSGGWGGQALVLARDQDGVWSGATPQLAPEIYEYGFLVDGLRLLDPGNPNVKPARSPNSSILEIPGGLIHERKTGVPHGKVAIHDYYSEDLKAWRRLHVYTPPGYEKSGASLPVLYLLHGSGDNDATWTVLGSANAILDNLLAEKKVLPMIVAMPDGHPVTGRATGVPGADRMRNNLEAFTRDVLNEVVPLVEKEYRALKSPAGRAVAGLSMGGGQAIDLGLNHPELFSAVGAFSSFVADPDKAAFRIFDAGKKPALIWTACGKDDFLLGNAKQFSENLKAHQVQHEFLITDGNHSWPVWRKYLAQFAPLLFRK